MEKARTEFIPLPHNAQPGRGSAAHWFPVTRSGPAPLRYVVYMRVAGASHWQKVGDHKQQYQQAVAVAAPYQMHPGQTLTAEIDGNEYSIEVAL